MSKNAKGHHHTKPCGDESCGLFDVSAWRDQAHKELEDTQLVRDGMNADEKAKLAKLWEGYSIALKLASIPGSIYQAVASWANMAADVESLRVSSLIRIAKEKSDKDKADKADKDKADKADKDKTDWPDWPNLPDIDGKIEIGKGASIGLGGLMPAAALVALGAFYIWSKPARAIKGTIK